MGLTYRTKFTSVLPQELVDEIKSLRRIEQGDLSEDETQRLRERISQTSLDLRLRVETVNAIAKSQLGVEPNGEIPRDPLDSLTVGYIQRANLLIDGFGDMIDHQGNYWLSLPQRYDIEPAKPMFKEQVAKYGISYVLLRGWRKPIDFDLIYPPLAIDAQRDLRERIIGDIHWMLENQCMIGVCTKDLSHSHICYSIDQNQQYLIPELNQTAQRMRDIVSLDPKLISVRAHESQYYPDYKKAAAVLNQFVSSDTSMHILYHTFENTNPDHLLYVNRTVLSTPTGRVCIVPTHGELGLSAEQINGISELPLRFYLRINLLRGNNNTDLANLQVYVAPLVGKL